MANLLTWLRQKPEISRYSLSDYIRQITQGYGLSQQAISYTAAGKPAERIPNSYVGYAEQAYGSSSVVGACMRVRRDTFRQAKFAWREITQDGTGKLKHDDGLSLLEKPWPNGTTGELLAKMITDVDLCGNSFVVNEGDRLRWRRPDWMYVVLSGDPLNDYDVDVVGYIYCPGGSAIGDGKPYLVDEVCHWSPIPHPTAEYVGMSWMTPALKDIQGDIAATDHKNSFFRNGTTLGPIFRLPATMTPDQFEKFKRITEQTHAGEHNAYRTLYVGGGAEVTLAASTFQQLEFKATQGGGETRIAALAGCHPAIVGLSEGLQGSSLNAGNFTAARRVIADITLFSLWQDACAALSTFVEVPDGFELWIREQAIPLLREDAKDAADIEQVRASTITLLVREGFTADSAVAATMQQDMRVLEHTGMTSVQLQPPGTTGPDGEPVDSGDETTDALSEALDNLGGEPDFGALRRGEIVRYFGDDPEERVKKGFKGGGRFRSLSQRIGDAIQEALDNDSDPFEGFTQPQLKAVAQKRGIELPKRPSKKQIGDLLLQSAGVDRPGKLSAPDKPEVPDKPEAPKRAPKRAPRKATKAAKAAGRPPAKPVPIRDLFEADDAAIEAAMRDVYEGQFGPFTTKVKVKIIRAGTRVDRRGRTREVEPSISVEGEIFSEEGGRIGNFGRSLKPQELESGGVTRREMWVDHAIVQMDEKYQGKGFGGEFNGRAIQWYRDSGVHGIYQNDANGYVWASQGFNFAGGVMPDYKAEQLQDLIARLRAGQAKNQFGDTIPKQLREAPNLDEQLAAAEELLARLKRTRPGEPGYPTAYEVSQLGRRRGQRGKTATWLGKFLKVSADELILNPDEGEVVS